MGVIAVPWQTVWLFEPAPDVNTKPAPGLMVAVIVAPVFVDEEVVGEVDESTQ